MTIGRTHTITLEILSEMEMPNGTSFKYVTFAKNEVYHQAKGVWIGSTCNIGEPLKGTSKKDITQKMQAELDEFHADKIQFYASRGFKIKQN